MAAVAARTATVGDAGAIGVMGAIAIALAPTSAIPW
jgi:hypothetical protein